MCNGGLRTFIHRKEREIERKAALKVSESFDEHDKESAMAKIADAASRWLKHPEPQRSVPASFAVSLVGWLEQRRKTRQMLRLLKQKRLISGDHTEEVQKEPIMVLMFQHAIRVCALEVFLARGLHSSTVFRCRIDS